MQSNLNEVLETSPVVPLVQSSSPAEAVKISQALLDGGLKVSEVVLRTDVKRALDCGAKFIVSPGFHPELVAASQAADVPVLPGVATASELQHAWNMGLRTVKFFPASLAGGPKMLKALSSVFRDVRFMPTGGVSATNLNEYLDVPAVLACGGSWLTPKDAIAAGDFAAVTKLAKGALAIAHAGSN